MGAIIIAGLMITSPAYLPYLLSPVLGTDDTDEVRFVVRALACIISAGGLIVLLPFMW